ncbi:hypothetical protein AMJ40_02380 [candidate division TA06 bacterium DG_26]|uniref:Nudix hydrolase domain-containing protein n=1 Tax=candidate division TA06 bacterium DG_26 TaxID=1703771 RepID=A0A0S7WKD9_UNCT6|nr:MAG: hypothetical protein AMJ40_02380 [candidate division TA06 bacterium DG_26]
MTPFVEFLARGVCISVGNILLVRKEKASHTFLPGGHICFGESAERALAREIEEEIGSQSHVDRFLGAVEHSWKSEGLKHHELNLIFEIGIHNLHSPTAPVSLEVGLIFFWHPVQSLKDVNLQPYPLQKLIPVWIDHDFRSGWGSSMLPNSPFPSGTP